MIFTLFYRIAKNPGGDLQFADTAGRGRAGLHAHPPLLCGVLSFTLTGLGPGRNSLSTPI